MVDSVLSLGIQGVQNGISGAQQAAQNIARSGTTAADNQNTVVDLTEAIVDLKINERQVEASAAVIKTADEILGTIIDIKA